MTPNEPALIALDGLAQKFSAAHATLDERCAALDAEVREAYRRKLPGIKSALAQVREHQSAILAILRENPHLFVKPRSIVVRGAEFGYEKGRGRIVYGDAEQLAQRVLKLFGQERFALLVKTTHAPRKKALASLSAAELRKLGCEVQEAGDNVFVRSVTSDIDKLVARLIKAGEKQVAGDTADDEDEEAA